MRGMTMDETERNMDAPDDAEDAELEADADVDGDEDADTDTHAAGADDDASDEEEQEEDDVHDVSGRPEGDDLRAGPGPVMAPTRARAPAAKRAAGKKGATKAKKTAVGKLCEQAGLTLDTLRSALVSVRGNQRITSITNAQIAGV